jgi:Protein of unknown function (DUF1236)
MTKRLHTLLAGVAALTLFAGSGIALAQQSPQNQQGGAPGVQTQHSQQGGASGKQTPRSEQGGAPGMQTQRSQQGGNNQAAGQGMKNQGAERGQNANAMSRQSTSAGQNARNQNEMQSRQSNAGKGGKTFNRSVQQQNKGTHAKRTAQSQQNRFNAENRSQRGASAQRNQQLNGLQGSTRAPMQGANEQGRGGANVSLNDRQRTQIRDTVINARNAPRVDSVDFDVSAGTVIPRGRIHMVRVPDTLIRIAPAWRGFLYFVYNDEIVVVNARTMTIVEVLPV